MSADSVRRSDDTTDDLAALARGGRTNMAGFVLRLGGRIPFLLFASRFYGADVLGRFALAVLVVEFGAQLATFGLKRGLAEQLARNDRPPAHVVCDAMVVSGLLSLAASAILIAFPQIMFPNSTVNGLDRLLPLTIFGIALGDVALAACAYRYDVGATVRARALVEPWAITIAAVGFWFYSERDGLILSYVVAMLAALVVAVRPTIRHFGWPQGWRADPVRLWAMSRRNLPLAAAEAIDWGTRRVDLWLLGLFVSPASVGVYYIAQQFASLPQKLKTSFEPVLGPVITRNIGEGNLTAVAAQVRQVGFWILAAQIGVSLAVAIPGQAVMGVMGPQFVMGTLALALLMAAEVTASPAVVSEAALVYLARGRNLWLSIATIALQLGLSLALLALATMHAMPESLIVAAPALALAVALGMGSVLKGALLCRLTGAPVSTWRPSLLVAALLAGATGGVFLLLPRSHEWAQLTFGIPAMLIVYGLAIWRFGFGPGDRALFATRIRKSAAG